MWQPAVDESACRADADDGRQECLTWRAATRMSRTSCARWRRSRS